MPAKPSGEIKTKIVHQTQKNGDIYVLERKTIYDPEKKYNRVLSSKLLSKIPKGQTEPVPTRPKKAKIKEQGNYSVLLRNPQFLHKVEKWKRAEKNQRNVNIQEAKKEVC